MKIYLAGNFPQMANDGGVREKRMCRKVWNKFGCTYYRRLVSFYWIDHSESVFWLKGKEKKKTKEERLDKLWWK